MKIIAVASLVVGVSALALACSSSSTPAASAKDAGSSDSAQIQDVQIDVIIDTANCVAPGTASNAQGIGGYCSPGGGQCDTAGPGGTPRICTADTGAAPAHAWFCTYPCTMDMECGAGATCVSTSQGQGCLPNACVYLEADSGLLVDSGTPVDAGAPTDSASPDSAH